MLSDEGVLRVAEVLNIVCTRRVVAEIIYAASRASDHEERLDDVQVALSERLMSALSELNPAACEMAAK